MPPQKSGLPPQALLQAAAQTQDSNGLRKACHLGLGSACSLYAQAIYDAADPDGDLPATVTHYALLGCMSGDVLGCKLAINRSENTLENAQFRAIEGGTGDANDLVTPELAKPGCDAGDAVSCVLLAREPQAPPPQQLSRQAPILPPSIQPAVPALPLSVVIFPTVLIRS
ncbi:hypothetical protein DEA98_25655 [Brucella pseudogrignonensis]|nr:hypothetical protein [Brucella pseudogrignonensis]